MGPDTVTKTESPEESPGKYVVKTESESDSYDATAAAEPENSIKPESNISDKCYPCSICAKAAAMGPDTVTKTESPEEIPSAGPPDWPFHDRPCPLSDWFLPLEKWCLGCGPLNDWSLAVADLCFIVSSFASN
ncbi:uncharacterized protein LOC114443106 isoform X3 [Parambassis ranga]|uniref:Uncharacterized protein LOC114443106 isoform X3 n=1 Tax=Parambassis ranga TaxID=210632 RepID=A0A6P7J9F3_9TELE|nr:uncharacterized protein LOC114443106 isoform X3 [Parambassis ranga]